MTDDRSLREYRDAFASNESSVSWGHDDFLHDMDDWLNDPATLPEASVVEYLRKLIKTAHEQTNSAMAALDVSDPDGWATYQRLYYGPLTTLGLGIPRTKPTETEKEADDEVWDSIP